LPLFSRVSRLQKLASPTFQVPPMSTATPFWFDSTGVPSSRMSYVTLAWVAEVTVTFVTLALAEDAPGKLAEDRIFEANADPFCSRLIRLANGVFGLKNATQLVVISATAFPLEVAVEGEELDGAAAGVVLALGLGGELDVDAPLLPHAAMLVPRAQITSMVSGIEYRVFTQTFSSFPM
jgi:hypothetical protein